MSPPTVGTQPSRSQFWRGLKSDEKILPLRVTMKSEARNGTSGTFCLRRALSRIISHSRSFDLECKGIELASGSQRIHNVELLTERMKACNLDPKAFETYLKAFRYGMPPHGGFGFGIERFLMELLDISNVRECILFPRDRTRLSP